MNTKRIAAMIAAALVLGVVGGNVASGWAAPAKSTSGTPTVASTVASCGLGLGASMRTAGGRLADVVAKLTGQDVADVTAKRAAGASWTTIAKDKGVSSSAVVDEALKVRATALADRVKAGTTTQAQADAALATMKTRLTERVASTNAGCDGTGGGRGAGRGNGGGMGRGAGAGGCGGACVTAPATNQ